MTKAETFAWHLCRLLLMPSIAFSFVGTAHATLATLDSRTIADSPEPILERIYSYDMAVDSENDVHIVYSKPTTSADHIGYSRRIGGVWQPTQILSTDGFRDSISTRIEVGIDGALHVCYIRQSTRDLYYRNIVNGVVGPERFVSNGAWHTEMQLGASGRPVFIREGEAGSSRISKLMMLSTSDNKRWRESVLALPNVTGYRLADFVHKDGVYHITFGDGAYEKQVLSGKGSSRYMQGVFHNLWYARSTNGTSWVRSLVDDSGALYEYEFWTALDIDGGHPVVGMYKYAEVRGQYNTGTSALIARWTGAAWDNTVISDPTYAETREGASIALVVDTPGAYLGVWDYSPDDTRNAYFRGDAGNMALARNGDDGSWSEKVQVDTYSAEGQIVLKKAGNNRLHILALSDFVDAKLFYRELDLYYVDREIDRIDAFPWGIFMPAIIGAGR